MTHIALPSCRTPRPTILKSVLLAASLLLGAAQTVSAQATNPPAPQWDIGNGTMSFLGCYAAPQGVQCDIVYTLVKVQAGLLALQSDDASYSTADGKTGDGKSVSIEGSAFAPSAKLDSVNGKPIRATFRLPLPASTTALRTLDIVGHRLNDVVVTKSAPAVKPATPVSTSTPPASTTISGTVSGSADLRGTVVFACVRQGAACDNSTFRYTEITGSGTQATYTITGLDRSRTYTVVGWLDLSSDGDLNAGDLLGSYDAGEQGAPVSPPHAGTDFFITVMN